MKTKILYILFILLTFQGFSQSLTPEFEFQLYFEDAAGNRDTVTLGYDQLATDTINSQFGEVNLLNTPWGNGLDVRIGNLIYHDGAWGVTNNTPPIYDFSDSINENTYLTKKKIIEHVCGLQFENASRRVSIQFTSNDFPIVVKWDKSPFSNNDCIGNTMIYGEKDHMQVDVSGNFLLGLMDSISILTNKKIEGSESIPIYNNPDSSSQEIYVLQFSFVNASTTSIDDNKLVFNQKEVYPNPVRNHEYLHVNLNGNFEITDLNGKIIQTGEIKNKKIFISSIQKGLYLLKVHSTSNTYLITKVLIK